MLTSDNDKLIQGAGNDYSQYFDGTNQNFDLTSGDFIFNGNTTIDGNVSASGETSIGGVTADGTGKVVCIKSDGDLGTCTDAPGATGTCTCN